LGGWAIAGAAQGTPDSWATNAGAQSLSATTTFNSNSVTLASGNTSQMVVGQTVSGGNIPSGSFITAITSSTVFTISQNASATGTATSNFTAAGIVPLNAAAYTTLVATPVGTVNYTTAATTT